MRPRTWSPKRKNILKHDTASGVHIQGENFTGPGAKEPKIKKRKVKQIENTTWDLKPKSKDKDVENATREGPGAQKAKKKKKRRR